MTRRSLAHNYSLPGIYHITLHVAEGMGQPLGTVVGSDASTAAVVLTAGGRAVEHELLSAITTHYPMITVDAHVIMPEHLHFILNVRAAIVSGNGRKTHLGQVLAGFKQGCNRAYWAATGQQGEAPCAASGEAPCAASGEAPCAAKPHSTVAATEGGATRGGVTRGGATEGGATATVPGGFAARKERFDTGRPPLFAPGYCDVMPVEPGQLDTIRTYIKDNPRSRWLRTHDRSRLQPRRDGIDTALTPAALRKYLQRECPARLATAEALAGIERRLIMAGGRIACHSYGDRALLQRRRLPVVCHGKDWALFEEQKRRCLEEAAQGAVLVSPRIAKGERNIMDEAANRGFATITIADNGFPAIYHPSDERISRCADGRLLIITPWQYEYRGKNEAVTVPFCKTMNCVTQGLCRMKDDWWQTLKIED